MSNILYVLSGTIILLYITHANIPFGICMCQEQIKYKYLFVPSIAYLLLEF